MDEQREDQMVPAPEVLHEPWLRCEHRHASGTVCRLVYREALAHLAKQGRWIGQLIAPRCCHPLVDAVYIDRETHRRLRGYAE
jgi:hypothetical protein